MHALCVCAYYSIDISISSIIQTFHNLAYDKSSYSPFRYVEKLQLFFRINKITRMNYVWEAQQYVDMWDMRLFIAYLRDPSTIIRVCVRRLSHQIHAHTYEFSEERTASYTHTRSSEKKKQFICNLMGTRSDRKCLPCACICEFRALLCGWCSNPYTARISQRHEFIE